MQGEKQEQDEMFFYGSLRDLVPEDDLLRLIDALVDFTWLRRETRDLYSQTGRPSIDPVVIIKLLLIAYLHGIASERELMRQVQVNLAYRLFLHYRLSEALPDHSNLTRSRQRLGEPVVKQLFEQVLQLCVDAGLVGDELHSVDSTFVQANASLSSLEPRLVAQEAERFTHEVFLLNPQPESESDDDDQDQPSSPVVGKEERLNQRLVSRTDPDSGLSHKSRGLGYSVHFAVDRAQRIITGVRTTGAQTSDSSQLVPLLDEMRERGLRVPAVVADRGYSAALVYDELEARQIEAFIPLLRRNPEVHGLFGRSHFQYNPAQDSYVCPQGAVLARIKDASPGRRYRARPVDCAACPLRQDCTRGKARTLRFSRYEAALEHARARETTTAAKRAARQRKICSEPMFGEAKAQHGLRRAHQRGQPCVNMQALLTATVLNLKRYIRALTRVFPLAKAARPLALSTTNLCARARFSLPST